MDSETVPRTDICEQCEREILVELTSFTGQHELIHEARTADGGYMPAKGGSATVRMYCRCGSVNVEFEPGRASSWDFPDGWMWEGEIEQ